MESVLALVPLTLNSQTIFLLSREEQYVFTMYVVQRLSEQEAFDVKSSASNINVTGGTIEIRPCNRNRPG